MWTQWENHLRCFCWTLRTTSSLPFAAYVCIEPILAIFTFFAHSSYWSISLTFLQHRNSIGGSKCSLRFLSWASIKLMSVKVTNRRGGVAKASFIQKRIPWLLLEDSNPGINPYSRHHVFNEWVPTKKIEGIVQQGNWKNLPTCSCQHR